jgi:hypothetical protein
VEVRIISAQLLTCVVAMLHNIPAKFYAQTNS